MTGPQPSPTPTDTVLAQDVPVAVDTSTKVPAAVVYQIPNDATDATVQIARATSLSPSTFPDPATHVAVVTFVSYDQGQTWEHGGTTTTHGGITTHPTEGEIAYTNRVTTLRPGTGRLLRVHQVILCGPATTLDTSVAVTQPVAKSPGPVVTG